MDESEEVQTTVDPLVGLPRIGHVVADKYEITKLVGIGGMGVVLKASHKLLGQEVAIKLLMPALGADKEALARFEREARTVVRLKSEHVTRVLDVGRLPNGIPYMVMEFLDGIDWAELIDTSSPLPIEQVVDRVLQVAEALGEAHSLGIVHRDLKPENVFVTHRPDGSECAKVLDFGLSKAPGSGGGSERPSRPLTATRQVMGTPNYMSPEQWESAHDVGPAADQWALGTLLYEMLTGEPAFDGTELGPVCAKITTQDPVPPRSLRPEIPEALELAVLRTLAKEPGERFASLYELASAIAPFGSRTAHIYLKRIAGLLRPGVAVEAPDPAAPVVATAPSAAQAAQTAPVADPLAPTAVAWPVEVRGATTRSIPPALLLLIVAAVVVVSFLGFLALLWPASESTGASPAGDSSVPAAPATESHDETTPKTNAAEPLEDGTTVSAPDTSDTSTPRAVSPPRRTPHRPPAAATAKDIFRQRQ